MGAVRAYEVWENQGRPNGCDLINSRHSDQQIISCVPEGWCSSLAARPTGCRQNAKAKRPTKRLIGDCHADNFSRSRAGV
jgi:hypothetical protein